LRLVHLEKGCSYLDKAVLTNAKEHDQGKLEVLVDDKEYIYVGYLDYKRFDRMTDEGVFLLSQKRTTVSALFHGFLVEIKGYTWE